MSQTFLSSFNFKGARTYVQGPDIFNWIVSALSTGQRREAIANIDFSAHQFARKQCQLLVQAEKPAAFCASFSMDTAAGPVSAYVVETGPEIAERREYDEDKIIRATRSEGKKISISEKCEYSTAEIAVSLTKNLHQRLFPAPGGKWIVTRFLLDELLPESYRELSVENLSNFKNKITKSEIVIDGRKIGYIFFSLV